jgi:hypothetical protein
MNKTMNPQNRVSSRTQTASLLNISRMLQGQHLLLYRDLECHAFEIYRFLGSVPRVVPFSAHIFVPPAASLVWFLGLQNQLKAIAVLSSVS